MISHKATDLRRICFVAKDSSPIVQTTRYQCTMKAWDLIQNLQDQDVFRHPLFEAVRGNIEQKWTSIPTDRLRVLCEVWQFSPAAFFKPWSLPVDVSKDDSFQPNRGGGHELPIVTATDNGDSSFTTYLNEPMIRFVIHAIYVHDIVLLESYRRKAGTSLPRNLEDLVRKAWSNNGQEASSSVIRNLVDYVKAGDMCLRVGARIGEASWFLVPQSLFEMTRFPSDKKLENLKSAISRSNLTNEAAKAIRKYQSGPHLPKRSHQDRALAMRVLRPAYPPKDTNNLDPGRSNTGSNHKNHALEGCVASTSEDRYSNSFLPSHCDGLNNACHTTLNRQLLPAELISSCLPAGVWHDVFSAEPPQLLLGERWNNAFSAEPPPVRLWEVWNNVFSSEPPTQLPVATGSIEHPIFP